MSNSNYQLFFVRPQSFELGNLPTGGSNMAAAREGQSTFEYFSKEAPRQLTRFSKLSQKLMNFIVRLACLYRVVPFKMIRLGHQNAFLSQCKPGGRFMCKLMALQVVVLSAIFVVGFQIRWVTKRKKNLILMGFHVVKIMQLFSSCLVMSMPLMYSQEIAQVYNSGPVLHRQLLRIGVSCPQWFEDIILALPIMSIHASTWFLPFVIGVAGYLNPLDPLTLSGLLELVVQVPRWLQPTLTTYDMLMMHMTASSCTFIMVVYWTYYVNVLKWLWALRNPKYKSLEQELAALESSHTFFESMCIFSAIFNIASVNMLSSMTCGIVAMTTVTLFVLLTQHSRLPFLLYAIFCFAGACLIFVIVVVMSQLGQIQKRSKDMIGVWSYRVTFLRARLAARKNVSSDTVGRADRLSKVNRSLRFFGIRFANIYFSVKSAPRIVEAILTFLIIALSMRQELH